MEDKEICPYNRSHLILKHRMSKHIAQCKKNYPNANLVNCPFNTNHIMEEDKLKHHILTCPSRQMHERMLAPVGPQVVKTVPDVEPCIQFGEDWDAEVQPQSFLDVKDELNRERPLLSLGELNTGKAKRRDFRIAEKERHLYLAAKTGDTAGNSDQD